MKRLNFRILFWVAATLFAVVGFTLFYLENKDFRSVKAWLEVASKSVTVLLVLWLLFRKWLWKLCIFQGWLVPFPCLHGTWQGSIRSNWVDPNTQQRLAPIPTQLSIYQTFTTIRCTQRTGESISRSFAEEILVDEDDPTQIELVFCYRNQPNETVRERSATHEGACVLRFSTSNGKRLSGYYWSNRMPTPTTGQIDLEFFKAQPLDALSPELQPHPLSAT